MKNTGRIEREREKMGKVGTFLPPFPEFGLDKSFEMGTSKLGDTGIQSNRMPALELGFQNRLSGHPVIFSKMKKMSAWGR